MLSLQEIKDLMYETRVYAVRTQSLVWTIQRTIEHINSLVARIEGLVGNLQAQQTIAQMDTTVSKTLALIEVQQAAYHRTTRVWGTGTCSSQRCRKSATGKVIR